MNKKPHATPESEINPEWLAEQLRGYVEMGMARESLKLARAILKQPNPAIQTFRAAIDAILVHADRLPTWADPVEEAFHALTQRDQRIVRHEMLTFYCAAGNYQKSQHFIPQGFDTPTGLTDLAFTLETWLGLGNLKEAKRLIPLSQRAVTEADDPVTRGLLVNNLAGYFIQTNQWESAMELWKDLTRDSCFAESAILGRIEIRLAQALHEIGAGFAALQHMESISDSSETTLPGQAANRWKDTRKQLDRMKSALWRVLPKGSWAQLGMAPRE